MIKLGMRTHHSHLDPRASHKLGTDTRHDLGDAQPAMQTAAVPLDSVIACRARVVLGRDLEIEA